MQKNPLIEKIQKIEVPTINLITLTKIIAEICEFYYKFYEQPAKVTPVTRAHHQRLIRRLLFYTCEIIKLLNDYETERHS